MEYVHISQFDIPQKHWLASIPEQWLISRDNIPFGPKIIYYTCHAIFLLWCSLQVATRRGMTMMTNHPHGNMDSLLRTRRYQGSRAKVPESRHHMILASYILLHTYIQLRFKDIWRYSCAGGKVFQEFLMGFSMIGTCGLVIPNSDISILSCLENEDLEIEASRLPETKAGESTGLGARLRLLFTPR